MSKAIGWKKIADTVRTFRASVRGTLSAQQLDAAADLCERMARGELVEREVDAEYTIDGWWYDD